MSQLDEVRRGYGVPALNAVAGGVPDAYEHVADAAAKYRPSAAGQDSQDFARAAVVSGVSASAVFRVLAFQVFVEDRFELCVFPTSYMLNQTRHDYSSPRSASL
jgi:hypothetical protein